MAKSKSNTAGSLSAPASCTSRSAKAFHWLSIPANIRRHALLAAVLIVCLFLIGGVGLFVVYPQLAGFYHWRSARQALGQHDFARARSHLQQCLQVWPQSGETAFLMARTCRRSGELAAARTHLLDAERLGWVPSQVNLERLLMEAQVGLVQPVEQELRRYLETRPDQQEVILEAFVTGSLEGHLLDEAYRWSTRWVEDHPDNVYARWMRGRVFEDGLRYDLAAEEYRQALERKPDFMAAHVRLGEMLLRQGQYALALPHFDAYLQGQPHDATALLGLARCQRYLHPPKVALATLDRLFADHDQHAGALLLRGQLELEQGHVEQALLWLQGAERQVPHEVETYQALASALRLLNRKDEAQACERKRQQIEGDLRRMEELTKQIIQSPKEPALRYEAGTTLLRLGQEQQGVRWLVSALLIDPQHQPTKEALASCLPKFGDAALVERYRHVLEQD